jgi:hypothetical protein
VSLIVALRARRRIRNETTNERTWPDAEKKMREIVAS